MKKLLALISSFLIIAGGFVPFQTAAAQGASVAAACSTQALPVGYNNGTLIVKQNGDLCTNASGGGGGASGGTSTAAAPTYVEGATDQPISLTLKGGQRVTPTDTDGDATTDQTNNAVRVNVVAGGSSGAQSNAASGLATSADNQKTVAWNYCWNGVTWDQCAPATSVTVTSGTISLTTNQGVTETPNVNATFSGSFTNLVTATSATDIFTITISGATKVSRLTRLAISCSAASAAMVDVTLVRRTTLDTTGTSTTATTTAVDSAFTSPVSVFKGYTVNPGALGTLAGVMRADKLFANVVTAAPDRLIWTWATSASQPALRATTDLLAVNLVAGNAAALTCNVSADVTEQ